MMDNHHQPTPQRNHGGTGDDPPCVLTTPPGRRTRGDGTPPPTPTTTTVDRAPRRTRMGSTPPDAELAQIRPPRTDACTQEGRIKGCKGGGARGLTTSIGVQEEGDGGTNPTTDHGDGE